MPYGNFSIPSLLRSACWSLLFLLAGLGPGSAWGKPPALEPWSTLAQPSFRHHPAIAANSFVQDRSGFVWVGMQSGLFRWDGYRMRRYVSDPADPKTLPDSYAASLHVDGRGRFWIGTNSAGLARYEPGSDSFVSYPAGPGGVSDVSVSALADDGIGGIWIGTGAGLDHMSADGVLTRGGGGAGTLAAADVPGKGIDAMVLDRQGRLWLGTRSGLFRRTGAGGVLQPVALAGTGAAPASIQALHEDSAGRLWIGTRNNGAFVIGANDSVARPVLESGGQPQLQRQRVTAIVEVAADEVWLGTEGAGIVAVNPGSGLTRRIQRQLGAPDSLPDRTVRALYRERGGLVFVATSETMSIYDPHPRAILTVRDVGATATGSMSISSILARPDGRLWLGVAGGGLRIVDPLQGEVGQLAPGQPNAGASLPTGRVIAMTNGPDGKAYIGTQQGLYRSDGRAVERLSFAGRPAGSPVWSTTFQGADLWLGGPDGIWKLALDPGQPARLLRHEAASLGDTRVTALLAGTGGTLWIGTQAGLAWLDGASGKVERIGGSGTSKVLGNGYISSLLMDRRGRLWVGVFGSGVALLDGTDAQGRPRLRLFGTNDGLPHAGVNALREDGRGFIWVSTDDGLARIDPASHAIRALGAAEGVKISSYYTNSSEVGASGELLFGGASGLTVVRPGQLNTWTYRPPLVVTAVSVNDVPVPAPAFNRDGAAGGARALIHLTPAARERGFAVEFAALDYSAPERNRYAYRLLGFDKGWIDTDASLRRVSYNNLPPGDYTLQLRGSNRDGAWSPPLELAVRADPMWFQQGWVRFLGSLGIAGLLAILLQARTAYLRRRQRELEGMVELRTAELRASQLQLEAMAYSDPLTGLPNRRRFTDDLRHMGARAVREHDRFTLLLIDLDHFKQVNDSLGHDAGDALLVEAARRMKLAVRESDRLARLGGDEFAVLLSNTGDEATIAVFCSRINAAMIEPIRFGEHTMRVSASIGAATFTGATGDLDELYKHADLALYATKSRGRNGWSLYGRAAAPVA